MAPRPEAPAADDPPHQLLKSIVEVDQTEVPFRTKEGLFDETKPRRILIRSSVEEG